MENFRLLQNDVRAQNIESVNQAEALVAKAQDMRLSIKGTLDSLEGDVRRLRKERDEIRALYERRNAELSRISAEDSVSRSDLTSIMAQILEAVKKTSDNVSDHLSNISEISNDSRVSELLVAINLLKDNEKAIYGELESLAQALDDSEKKLRASQKELLENQGLISKLQNDKLKAEFSSNQAKKEAEIALQKAQALERLALSRLEAAENQEIHVQRQVAKLNEQISSLLIEVSRQSATINLFEGENKKLNERIERLSTLRLEDTISDLKYSLDQCHSAKAKAEEELHSLQRRLSSSHGKDLDKAQLQEELTLYKKLMKCNSCHIRDKNAVVTKCMHVFCRSCLDNRIETRQRKCPNCGEPFGANDIRTIYL